MHINQFSCSYHWPCTVTTHALPKSLCAVCMSFKLDDYVEYVVCTKCYTLYNLSECIIDNHSQQKSKRCCFIQFPNDPHPSRCKACNEVLMKIVKIVKGIKLYQEKCLFIVSSLKEMAKRKGFRERCDNWRTQVQEGALGDI